MSTKQTSNQFGPDATSRAEGDGWMKTVGKGGTEKVVRHVLKCIRRVGYRGRGVGERKTGTRTRSEGGDVSFFILFFIFYFIFFFFFFPFFPLFFLFLFFFSFFPFFSFFSSNFLFSFSNSQDPVNQNWPVLNNTLQGARRIFLGVPWTRCSCASVTVCPVLQKGLGKDR